MSIHVYGIRHHGPGCARSLRAALDKLRPDVVVLEGPPDAEEVLPLSAHEGMKPPLALLIYPADEPGRGVYYPLAVFSPEWQTLCWAHANHVPVRLMDLPQSHQLAIAAELEQQARQDEPSQPEAADLAAPAGKREPEEAPNWRTDPIAVLAEAAGFQDHELWWEQQVERRQDATDLFVGILEAMRSVREAFPETRERDLLRESYMRRTLRQVLKEGAGTIAVVCGAWHAPVLDEEAVRGKREGCLVKDDESRLKGLPKRKTAATWIPWTHSRLTYRSGYGAGVHSPGWYAHLWEAREAVATRWVATAARLLRERDLDASLANVIEAVRLADALAAMRELRSPGLTELNEAILSVLCRGDVMPMRLIRNRLEVGDVLGEVPEDTPSVPLARDLAQLQKSLRLKPSTEVRLLDLDLRGDTDRARSHLLHRLGLLGIAWGIWQKTGGKASTFHEVWQIQWHPEFALAVIEANIWGTTIETAATSKAIHEAETASELARTTALLDAAILAGLNAAVDPLLARIQSQGALGADVRHLMDAMPPLARIARYGDVRGTQAGQVAPILSGMFERVVVGLPLACASLDDEAVERMLASVGNAQQALDLMAREDLNGQWQDRLQGLLTSGVHALVRGWCCRLLVEKGRIGDDELYRLARLALSAANPPAECAAWVTGLLRGSGLLLLHQQGVWHAFDRWLAELSAETFAEMAPLLRRAFSDFSTSERRQMGEKVKHLRSERSSSAPSARQPPMANLDLERARRALPVLSHIFGVELVESSGVAAPETTSPDSAEQSSMTEYHA